MTFVKQPFLVAYEAYNSARQQSKQNRPASYMTFGDTLLSEEKPFAVEIPILYKHYVPWATNGWGFANDSPVKKFFYTIFSIAVIMNLPIKFIYNSSSRNMYIVCKKELYDEIAPLCREA